MTAVTQSWSSRFGFLMAAVGFAVGLGNIWRFPYVAGENGGSAFVLVYLVCVFAIGVPILMAEVLLGRRGGSTPPVSVSNVAQVSNSRPAWRWLGYLTLLTAFTIQLAYTVVAGWVLYYLYLAFDGFAGVTSATSQLRFDALLASPAKLWGLATLPLLAAAAIVYLGVQNGIERAVKVLMPTLFGLMAGLAIYNAFAGGMSEALVYLFSPDWGKVTPSVVLAAVSQAFFSMGVAMAGMMMFGAYLPRNVNITSSVAIVALADTLVALLAGMVIFPIVFLYDLDPAGGVGLIFSTLPVAFAQMTQGILIAPVFFLLLSVAAITSLVGFFEPVTAWVMQRFEISRQRAVVYVVLATLAGSSIAVVSYNVWQHVQIAGMTLSDLIDFVPNQIFLPLGGLLIAVFVGWVVPQKLSAEELELPAWALKAWHVTLRFVVVPAVAIILISGWMS